ncbi:hypothetical protein FBY35_3498 [Streptomyces sp. SLBN-118]|uniref:DUF5819 family protein n=1 Tax=Streptomyces sp. SLBN-118 TaxID=2768454 RepID=UPI0011544CE7|nr:DUF5819 family protein [Streptomyces sp. SLBN-118]TQK53030.1 hypothetical protein FBY35_3498 [Streptomyces sp. SLBN-118]
MDSYEDEDAGGAGGLSSETPAGHGFEPVPAARREAVGRSEAAPQSELTEPELTEPEMPEEPELPQAAMLELPAPELPHLEMSQQAELPQPERNSGPGPAPARGIAALSLPYQVAAALSLAIIAALACVHLAMVFLHVAPPNTVTKKHGEAVDGWIYPEFEQNWKLFAPNPLQQNVDVEVKVEYVASDGSREITGWIDLTADDGQAIRGNPLPSHVQQNELRRAWDFYVNSHDNENRGNGLRGQLSENYVRRIVMTRLDKRDLGGPVERIQLRSSTRSVKAPEWSDEKIDTRPAHRVLPWWTITAADLPGGVRNGRTEASR